MPPEPPDKKSTRAGEPKPERPRPSRTRRFLAVAGPSLILLLLLANGARLYLRNYADTPARPGERPIVLAIAKGQGMAEIADTLAAAGLIEKPRLFRLLSRIRDQHTRIKAGEYSLSAAMSPAEILDLLVSGKEVLYRLTIPEGSTIADIARLAEEKELCESAELLALCFDPKTARSLGIQAPSLEGFLYPDTYLFPRSPGARAVITTMAARFFQVFTPQMEEQAKNMGLSMLEAVTLASIIEKESGDHSEGPLISSVFHNRLKKRMRLQSDPTVIYGIKNFNGNLTRKDLNTPTPYNTYTIPGLPPGPIASPGEAALTAALNPAKSKYLFFVARGNGSHEFSSTLAQHNRAVRKYQLRKGR